MSTLSERAVACRHFRWLPGMLTEGEERVTEVRESVVLTDEGFRPMGSGLRPDLSDPATVGCLLALVRDAHAGSPAPAFTVPLFDPQRWRCLASDQDFDGDTEVAALIAALEAAP